jgi:hypothetical protein
MKTCRFCAEEIQDAAIKCKHCGETLVTTAASPDAAIPDPTLPTAAQKVPYQPRRKILSLATGRRRVPAMLALAAGVVISALPTGIRHLGALIATISAFTVMQGWLVARLMSAFAVFVMVLVIIGMTLPAVQQPPPQVSAATNADVVSPQLEQIRRMTAMKERVKKMKGEGASDAEILKFANEEARALILSNTAPLSLYDYEHLHDGMSYPAVCFALLHYGKEASRVSLGGTTTVMYQWINPDGSNMNATFQDDRLVAKAQFGLR